MADAPPVPHTPPVQIAWPDTGRVARWGLAAVVALAAVGGAWAVGHQRYGEMLNEWRWRGRLKDVKSVQTAPAIGIGIALLLPQTPQGDTREGGAPCRSFSGCSAYPLA
jgi:hypothetical protein